MTVDWDAIIERVPVLRELADAINEREVSGAVGGTDEDGNVYSIEYDNTTLKVRCVKPDGSEAFVEVGPNTAQLRYSDVPGDVINGVTVGPEGVQIESVPDLLIGGNPLDPSSFVVRTSEIPNPTGGGTIDTEARTAIDAILARMAPDA